MWVQERGSLFPFVVIAVTALQLLWSPACFTTPLLVHVNQNEETLFWHFSREKGFVTWYFPMSRHLDVQVSLSESISLSYPCTSLSSNLQQSVYHLPGRIYSGILFVPTVYMVGITAARSPFMFMTCISLGSSLGSQPGRVWLDGYWEGGGRWWMKWMGRGEGSPAFMLNLSWQLPSRLWASNARRLPMRKSAVILYSPCVGRSAKCECKALDLVVRSRNEAFWGSCGVGRVSSKVGVRNILKTPRFQCTFSINVHIEAWFMGPFGNERGPTAKSSASPWRLWVLPRNGVGPQMSRTVPYQPSSHYSLVMLCFIMSSIPSPASLFLILFLIHLLIGGYFEHLLTRSVCCFQMSTSSRALPPWSRPAALPQRCRACTWKAPIVASRPRTSPTSSRKSSEAIL